MPRFSKKLAEFKKSRNPKNDYFTMISVRHPLGRLYSAWKDKFRNDHLWWKAIKSKFGDMLYELERKNMTDEPYEVSFEAFLELVALSKFDSDRDRHWKSIQGYCGSCNFEYDFILKVMAINTPVLILWDIFPIKPLVHIELNYLQKNKRLYGVVANFYAVIDFSHKLF